MKKPIEGMLQGGSQRPSPPPAEMARLLEENPEALAEARLLLSGDDPRVRGGAAAALADLAARRPELVLALAPDLAAALDREETQTRLEACRALATLAVSFPAALEEDFDTIRLGVFDPANADIRAWTARALGSFGAGDAGRGRRAFPHLAEALRRFHDRPGAAGPVEGLARLVRPGCDETLGREVWKAVRRHETHPEPAVRALVVEIAARLGRSTADAEPGPPR